MPCPVLLSDPVLFKSMPFPCHMSDRSLIQVLSSPPKPSQSLCLCQSHPLRKPYSRHLVGGYCAWPSRPDFSSALQGPSSTTFLGHNGFSTVSKFILFFVSSKFPFHFSSVSVFNFLMIFLSPPSNASYFKWTPIVWRRQQMPWIYTIHDIMWWRQANL